MNATRINRPCTVWTGRKSVGCAGRLNRRIVVKSSMAEQLGHKTVISVGEALFDCLADQLGKPKEEVTSWTPYPGGAPANVATGLARLGVHSVILTALGKDQLGDQFYQLLQDRKVDTQYVQRNNKPTRDVLVTRTIDGDRHFAGFGAAKTTEYTDCFINESSLPLDALKTADVLVTGTLGLAYPETAAAIRRAASTAKEGGHCTVVVDVNWRPVFWDDLEAAKQTVHAYLSVADIVKVTDEEAEWLFGIPAAQALEHPETVLQAVPSAKGVLVSAGEKGSAYSFKAPAGKMNISGVVPVLNVKVADTTGAGDAYLAGFIFYTLLSGGIDALVASPEKLERAIQFATGCGAATCLKPGAIDAQPTVHEVEELLKQSGWNV